MVPEPSVEDLRPVSGRGGGVGGGVAAWGHRASSQITASDGLNWV